VANFRYFAEHKGETIRFDHVDYRGKEGAFGYVPSDRAWIKIERTIEYKSRPSRHECDARCMFATGRTMKCECSCGGKNHGKGTRITCEAA
jgi:hypothetical protein